MGSGASTEHHSLIEGKSPEEQRFFWNEGNMKKGELDKERISAEAQYLKILMVA